MTEWQFYPAARPMPPHLREIIAVLEAATGHIGSKAWKLASNQMLALIADPLAQLGYRVDTGSTRAQKVCVPVLFGCQGRVTKAFEVDAYSENDRTVIEVEAGRGVVNNQFLKDLVEACVMPSVDYLVIALRSDYRGQNDFERVCFRLPLSGVLVVGY